MKSNVVFTVAGVLWMVLGLAMLLVPGTLISAASGSSPAATRELMTVRFAGVELFGLGLIAWLIRNAEASKARDGATLGFTIYFALHALTSLYGQFTDPSTTMHWVMAAIQGLFAVGFFLAGKAGMSKSTP